MKRSYRTDVNLKLTAHFAPARTRTFRDIVCAVVNSGFRTTSGFSLDMGLGGMKKQVSVEGFKCLRDTLQNRSPARKCKYCLGLSRKAHLILLVTAY